MRENLPDRRIMRVSGQIRASQVTHFATLLGSGSAAVKGVVGWAAVVQPPPHMGQITDSHRFFCSSARGVRRSS